jgi:predicted RNA binding protein YcfA (HicA-like mRNA interferase family)
MSEHLPAITGTDLIRLLKSIGFAVTRINGSHYRMHHPDGSVTTVPVHGNEVLPKGLLRKIIREDLGMTLFQFIDLWKSLK